MFCVACGGDVPAGSRFCPRCGRAVSPSEHPTGADAPPSPPPPAAPPGPSAPPGTFPPPGSAPPPPAPPPPPPGYGAGQAPGGSGAPGGYGPPPGGYPTPPFSGGAAGPVAYGLATFGQRAGGLAVDTVVVWMASFVLFLVAAATVPEPVPFVEPDPGPTGIGGLFELLGYLLGPVYYVVCEGRPEGQTLGKKALGIRVVRQRDGGPLGYGLALGRLLARLVNVFTFGIGWLWAAWDPQRQALHDKLAGTVVVRSSVYPPPARSTNRGPTS